MTSDTSRAEHSRPALRLTRDLVNRLAERTDKRGPVKIEPPDPDFYARTADQILQTCGDNDPLWTFAIGSLIWNPRFEVAERRIARAPGFQRAFCYGPETRMRGNPDAPGRMLSLDRGPGECWGVALRMVDGDRHAILENLLRQEPPFPPEWIHLETDDGPLRAIAFTAFRDFYGYQPEPPVDELADILASAVGFIGSMPDYILNTVTELERAGLHDPHLWHIQELVAERLERLPPRS